jgi:hypothetical protein
MNLKFSCAKLLAAKDTLVSQSRVYKKFGKDLKGSDRIGFMKRTYKVITWDVKTASKDYIMTLFTNSPSALEGEQKEKREGSGGLPPHLRRQIFI